MTGSNTRRGILKATGAIGISFSAGCSSLVGGNDSGSITIGSKQFTEQELLGYMSYHMLNENTDLEVVDEVGLGGTNTNFQALKEGEIDTYWEYTGTAWLTLPPQHDEVISDPQEIYDRVKSNFEEEHGITFLDRAPFNNTYVLLANPDWQAEVGIETMSEFASYVQEGNTDLTVVMNAEFQERSDGWPGLVEHYGFADAASNLNIRNVGSGLTYQVIGEGEAEVGMGFNTNPNITRYDLVTLKDDEGFFPIYNPAPMVQMDTLEDNEAMTEPLNNIAASLSTETIRQLNQRVSIDNEDASEVARSYLSDNDLI